jgi:hypothetical protein
MLTTTSVERKLNEFVAKFDKDFSLFSFLSTSTTTMSVWFLDNDASHHMIEALELFSSLTEMDLDVQVELGDDAKFVVKGEGTTMF